MRARHYLRELFFCEFFSRMITIRTKMATKSVYSLMGPTQQRQRQHMQLLNVFLFHAVHRDVLQGVCDDVLVPIASLLNNHLSVVHNVANEDEQACRRERQRDRV